MKKSIKALTDQISKLVNAVATPSKDSNKDSKDSNGNKANWGKKGKGKGKSNDSKTAVAVSKALDHSQSQTADSLFRDED